MAAQSLNGERKNVKKRKPPTIQEHNAHRLERNCQGLDILKGAIKNGYILTDSDKANIKLVKQQINEDCLIRGLKKIDIGREFDEA